MQPALPIEPAAGGPARFRVDLSTGKIRPANPRTVALALSGTWTVGRSHELRGSLLADSVLLSRDVSGAYPGRFYDLARILGALHLVGKVFGGDLHPNVPSSVRVVVDGYHSACRSTVLRDLGLFEAPEELRYPIARSAGNVAAGLLDEERKLLPGRLDRLVSAFVSLFRTDPGNDLLFADAAQFVSDRSAAVHTVDLRPLRREGRAVVVPVPR